jgi:hypothetical protein
MQMNVDEPLLFFVRIDMALLIGDTFRTGRILLPGRSGLSIRYR